MVISIRKNRCDQFSSLNYTITDFPTARTERYCHLGSDDDDDDETNDDESSLELRQFSSVAHRFSKVLVTALLGLHL